MSRERSPFVHKVRHKAKNASCPILGASQAVKWFRLSARQGFPQACQNLGICYQTGTGVRKDLPKAVELFRQAVEGGRCARQVLLSKGGPVLRTCFCTPLDNRREDQSGGLFDSSIWEGGFVRRKARCGGSLFVLLDERGEQRKRTGVHRTRQETDERCFTEEAVIRNQQGISMRHHSGCKDTRRGRL